MGLFSYCEGSRRYCMDSVCFYIYNIESQQLINMMSVAQALQKYPDIVQRLKEGSVILPDFDAKLNLRKD